MHCVEGSRQQLPLLKGFMEIAVSDINLTALYAACWPAGTVLRYWNGLYWHYGLLDVDGQVINNSKQQKCVVKQGLHRFANGQEIESPQIQRALFLAGLAGAHLVTT